tara:strand:- start:450 stop:641 length:192 start_codon:yes stop_codon:yes gene_type:complete
MTVKELIEELQTYPSNAIVQLNSCTNTGGSENISKIKMEDEYNQTVKYKMKGQIYVDLIGDSI